MRLKTNNYSHGGCCLAVTAALGLMLPLLIGGAGTAYGNERQCSPDIILEDVDGNVEVDGFCLIAESRVNGNVMLDEADDRLQFQSGTLNGNIEAEDGGFVLLGGIPSIGLGGGPVKVNGDVKSERVADATFIGSGATIKSDVEVKDGNLVVAFDAEIFGNVIHLGTGICVILPTATVHGNIEGDCVSEIP